MVHGLGPTWTILEKQVARDLRSHRIVLGIWCPRKFAYVSTQKSAEQSPGFLLSFPLFSFSVIIWQCVKTNSTPVVHIKIAGKWMFIPLKMVFS